MQTLASMIGEMIIVRIPLLNPEGLALVRLHGLESHGMWIESQDFTNELMKKLKLSSSRTTPLVFVPFARIDFVLASLDSLSLSETAFGV